MVARAKLRLRKCLNTPLEDGLGYLLLLLQGRVNNALNNSTTIHTQNMPSFTACNSLNPTTLPSTSDHIQTSFTPPSKVPQKSPLPSHPKQILQLLRTQRVPLLLRPAANPLHGTLPLFHPVRAHQTRHLRHLLRLRPHAAELLLDACSCWPRDSPASTRDCGGGGGSAAELSRTL